MSRSFTNTTDAVSQGTAAIPTTGTMFAWYFPTYSLTDSLNHDVFRVRQTPTLALFDFFCHRAGDNAFTVGWFSGGTDSRVISAAGAWLTQNAWNACLSTWVSATSTNVYVNGSSVGSNANALTWNTAGVTRTIGNDAVVANQPATGRIGELALWNVVLSANEITALANGKSPLLIRPDALVDYLPMGSGYSTEPNLVNGGTAGTLTGTSLGNNPPVRLFSEDLWTHRSLVEPAAAGGLPPIKAFARQANNRIASPVAGRAA